MEKKGWMIMAIILMIALAGVLVMFFADMAYTRLGKEFPLIGGYEGKPIPEK